jgi:hypothetical protein
MRWLWRANLVAIIVFPLLAIILRLSGVPQPEGVQIIWPVASLLWGVAWWWQAQVSRRLSKLVDDCRGIIESLQRELGRWRSRGWN